MTPTPAQIRAALESAGLSQEAAAATVGRDGVSSDRRPWVLVALTTGAAAMTVEEAYSLGARELQSWPV